MTIKRKKKCVRLQGYFSAVYMLMALHQHYRTTFNGDAEFISVFYVSRFLIVLIKLQN